MTRRRQHALGLRELATQVERIELVDIATELNKS
jgi:hypothetical protein